MCPCSAGLGRTGTFITIDQTLEQVEKEKVVNIAQVINTIRRQRMKMVQTLVCGRLNCIADTIHAHTHTHIQTHIHISTQWRLDLSYFNKHICSLPTIKFTSYFFCLLTLFPPQDQYSFIHNAILESVMCGDTQINTADLRIALHSLQASNRTEETGFHHQLNVRTVS